MGDPARPPDFGEWIRGRDINDQAESRGSGARIAAVVSFASGTNTGWAFVVSDIGGGTGGGTDVSVVGGNITAHQGNSGTQAWPVQFLAAQSVNAIQSGAWAVAANVTANVSQSVNVTNAVSIAAAQSISVAITGTQAVSIPTSAQPIAVQPRVTGNPTTLSFSFGSTTATSISTTLAASSNGTRILIKAYGVFNGDTTIHDFALLNGASNSTIIPAFLAANAGGHNIAYADPLPCQSNVGLAVAVSGAIGTRGVVGYVELGHVTTA